MGSEALLLLLANEGHTLWLLWLVASAGNILGSCINYALGYWSQEKILHKYQSSRSWNKANHWFQKYGSWSLLFAWLPVIGDPLTLLAGITKTRFWLFLTLVSVGKAGRYAGLLFLLQN